MRRHILSFILVLLGISWGIPAVGYAQNGYTLEVTSPRTGSHANHRPKRAYTGLEWEIRIAAIGGTWPYTYSLVNAPAGMTVEEGPCDGSTIPCTAGTVTWTNPTTTASNIQFCVTDGASTTDCETITVTVGTSGFNFVDAVNGVNAAGNGCSSSCGTGTLANPWRTLSDVALNAAGGSITYFRAGTYDCTDMAVSGATCAFNECCDSPIWIAYPGEAVTLDFANRTISVLAENTWIQGFSTIESGNIGFQLTPNGTTPIAATFYKNTMSQHGPGVAEMVPAMLYVPHGTLAWYAVIQNNTFSDFETSSAIKTYALQKALFEDNTFHTNVGVGDAALAIKGDHEQYEIRHNYCYNMSNTCVGGNQSTANDGLIRFNNLISSTRAIIVNQNGESNLQWLYRNTFVGEVQLNAIGASEAFQFTNNVIINADGGNTIPYIEFINNTDTATVVMTDNLTGASADSIVDVNGVLQGSYSSTYLGSRGFQLSAGGGGGGAIGVAGGKGKMRGRVR